MRGGKERLDPGNRRDFKTSTVSLHNSTHYLCSSAFQKMITKTELRMLVSHDTLWLILPDHRGSQIKVILSKLQNRLLREQ